LKGGYMKRYSVTEEIVMNPDYMHLRYGRIEKQTRHYPDEIGYIRVPKEMFDTIRDIIDDWED